MSKVSSSKAKVVAEATRVPSPSSDKSDRKAQSSENLSLPTLAEILGRSLLFLCKSDPWEGDDQLNQFKELLFRGFHTRCQSQGCYSVKLCSKVAELQVYYHPQWMQTLGYWEFANLPACRFEEDSYLVEFRDGATYLCVKRCGENEFLPLELLSLGQETLLVPHTLDAPIGKGAITGNIIRW